MKTSEFFLVQRGAALFGVILASFLLFGFASSAYAESPAGCSLPGFGLTIAVWEDAGGTVPATSVESGQTVYYQAFMSYLGFPNCDFDGDVTLTLPDGTTSNHSIVVTSSSITDSTTLEPYVVAGDDVGNNGAPADHIRGTADFSGTSERNPVQQISGSTNIDTPYSPVALEVSKTAIPAAEETYEWIINKSVTPATWDLFMGDSGTSEYTIDLTKSLVGTAYSLSGVISIYNPAQFATAVVTDVSDVVDGVGSVDVVCPEATPFEVDPDETIECTYDTDLPDDTAGDNSVNVTTSGDVAGGGAVEPFDPSTATPSVVNDEVNVNDTFDEGDNGPFSTSDSYTYSRQFTCGEGNGEYSGTDNEVMNTATITETGDSDDALVTINCYDLTVEKTANTSYDRQYFWGITKDADTSEITISAGQSYVANYDVVVEVVDQVDSNWQVSGEITVTNNHPTLDAAINNIADQVSPDITATIDFGSCTGAPDTVPAGGSITCPYGSVDLPDGTTRTNTASVEQQNFDYDKDGLSTTGGTTDYEGSASVTFGDPANVIDESIDVDDTYEGVLGTVTVDEAPVTFSYSREIGLIPIEECGDHQVDNTASFVTNDTATPGSDDHTILVHVPCFVGCTLTQGYWKTHSQLGPAPYDSDGWGALGDFDGDATNEEEGEDWEHAGIDWYTAFWTPPKGGNLWYKLAHQFQAAYLNVQNGADDSALGDVLADAEDWLWANSPEDKIKGKDAKEANKWHGMLASFNEGDIGPGHCDEDGNSVPN